MEKCSDDVVVRITTNGTVTPKFNGKDIFDYIPKFKKFIINVSIEFWEREITIYDFHQSGNVSWGMLRGSSLLITVR